MKYFKLFVLLLAICFSTNVADAQIFGRKSVHTKVSTCTKIEKKEFKNANAVNIQIDLSNATIMGLDSTDFVAWYSNNSGELTLKRFKNYVVKTVKEYTKKKVYYPAKEDAPYLLKLDIEAISENAGINAILYVYKTTGDAKKELIRKNIKISDGRMNTFDVLLQENAEDLGEKVAREL